MSVALRAWNLNSKTDYGSVAFVLREPENACELLSDENGRNFINRLRVSPLPCIPAIDYSMVSRPVEDYVHLLHSSNLLAGTTNKQLYCIPSVFCHNLCLKHMGQMYILLRRTSMQLHHRPGQISTLSHLEGPRFYVNATAATQ